MSVIKHCVNIDRSFIWGWMLCRSKHKINVSKPRIAPLPRRIFEEVTKPIIPSILDSKPLDSCSILKKKQQQQAKEENAYEQYLIAKCRKMFADFSSHTIAIYQPLTMQFWPLFEVRNKFLRKGLDLHIHYEDVLRQTVLGSRWQHLSPLLEGRLVFMVGKTASIQDILTLSKNTPQLLLLGAVMEDRILTRDDLIKYSRLPAMDVMLADTVSTLNSHASRLSHTLTVEQSRLATNLRMHSQS